MARKRKAGDGTVRQRKDGRWEGRIVIGYDDNGYPKTKNVLAKTKKECVEKLQKLKEDCGGLKPEKVRSEMPFGDWLTYWYENHSKPKIRPTTQETYESRIRLHIIPEIGDIPLNKLTQNDLQQFYGRLKKSGRKRFTDKYGEGLSDRMVRMCHATCRSALEKAVQDGLIRVNPAIGCKLPPKKAREMQVLTREELQRFLIQAKFEGYYDDARAEFDALEQRLNHNLAKDLDHNKEVIKAILAGDIVAAYYFQRGSVENKLLHDKQWKEAVKLLNDMDRYQRTLQTAPQEETAKTEGQTAKTEVTAAP